MEVLVFVEGLETEERYLTFWHRRHRDRVLVSIDAFRGGPLQLVEHAVQAKARGDKDARRGRGRPYDEIWCVFDVDEHPHLAAATELARKHSIRVAVSNPCLELWFLLHYEDCNAYINRVEAQRRARGHLRSGKVLADAALVALAARHCDAVSRAVKLDVKHRGDGSPDGENPSSNVWQLIDLIRGAREAGPNV